MRYEGFYGQLKFAKAEETFKMHLLPLDEF